MTLNSMKQQAFKDTSDILPSPARSHVLAALIFVAATICLAGGGLLYIATDGFTRGTISDLSADEKFTIDAMQSAGILVRDAAFPCTMQPHVVLKVKWDTKHGGFCVSSIGLRNIEIEELQPYIGRFRGLEILNVPYLPSAERERVGRLVPSLLVTGTE